MPAKKFTDAQEIEICEYYWTKMTDGYYPSHEQINAKFGSTPTITRAALRRHGYPYRTVGETRQGRSHKPANHPNGPNPLCACGCGASVKWISKQSLWLKYVPGHYRPKKPYHNPEWLRTEYIAKLRTVDEIADDFGVAPGTVAKAMRKHGIERRAPSESVVLRGSMRGENSPAWRGGKAKQPYSHDWPKIRRQIKDRDKWTCQLCKKRYSPRVRKLHVHHIDEDKTNNHSHNLISLCAGCHLPIHGKKSIRSKLAKIAKQNTI